MSLLQSVLINSVIKIPPNAIRGLDHLRLLAILQFLKGPPIQFFGKIIDFWRFASLIGTSVSRLRFLSGVGAFLLLRRNRLNWNRAEAQQPLRFVWIRRNFLACSRRFDKKAEIQGHSDRLQTEFIFFFLSLCPSFQLPGSITSKVQASFCRHEAVNSYYKALSSRRWQHLCLKKYSVLIFLGELQLDNVL